MHITKNHFCCTMIILVFAFQGCSTKPSTIGGRDSTSLKKIAHSKSKLKEFLRKFKLLSLPLTIKTFEISVDSLRKLNKEDNKFLQSEETDDLYPYGILPDTINNYKVIWLEPAEVEVPVLTTFTKYGKKIKEENLGVGGCGSDCGFKCSEFIMIDKNLSIFSGDSIKSTDCDTNGNFKSNTTKRYLRYKTGKILQSGQIKMSAILEKPTGR